MVEEIGLDNDARADHSARNHPIRVGRLVLPRVDVLVQHGDGMEHGTDVEGDAGFDGVTKGFPTSRL